MNIRCFLIPFYDHLRLERQLSAHTVSAYTRDLDPYGSLFSAFDVDAHRSILMDLEHREYAPRTLARKLAALRAFYRFVVAEGVSLDPMIQIPTAAHPSMMPAKALSVDHIQGLFSSLDPAHRHYLRDRALLEILYGAGLRLSECVYLLCRSVHLEQEWVLVMGKGRKERRVPLHQSACAAIGEYLTGYRGNQTPYSNEAPLFLAPSGSFYSRQGLYRIVNYYLRKSGCPAEFTPHSLRHAFATHLIDQQVGTLDIQQLLGHASIRSTQHYISIHKKALKTAYHTHWAGKGTS